MSPAGVVSMDRHLEGQSGGRRLEPGAPGMEPRLAGLSGLPQVARSISARSTLVLPI